jgi:putative ABC transport system permease protein
LRTGNDPSHMATAVLQSMSAFNRNLPISEVASMERVISDQLWRQRLASILMAAFAGVAVLLAAVGIYGVISHSMRHRTQEIGIRMALGAESSDLISLALREGMKPVLIGAVAGLIFALALTRFMQTLLYGVSAADPLTFAGIIAVLMTVCIAANLIPALKLTRVDPVEALRQE